MTKFTGSCKERAASPCFRKFCLFKHLWQYSVKELKCADRCSKFRFISPFNSGLEEVPFRKYI